MHVLVTLEGRKGGNGVVVVELGQASWNQALNLCIGDLSEERKGARSVVMVVVLGQAPENQSLNVCIDDEGRKEGRK